MKENLCSKQLWLNYINNESNKQKRILRLVISSIRICVVAKTDDEIYVLTLYRMG